MTKEITASAEFVLIIHEVQDYPKWKAIFDQAAQMRSDAGEIEYHLLAAAGNARQVVHFSRWRSLEAARAFFDSDALVEIRRRAGVRAPEFLYLHEVERAALPPPQTASAP
jgi:heme-degrading monooxygenase HmoA